MAEINKQDLFKAFYKFDKCGMVLTKIDDIPVANQKDPKERLRLADVWLELFAGLSQEVWEDAVKLATKHSKVYPSNEEMLGFVSMAEHCESVDKSEEPVYVDPERVPTKANPPKEQRMQEMFSRAKKGDWAGACALLATTSEDEIVCYAREHWPSCSDSWIKENIVELGKLLEQEKKCANCMNMSGYRVCGFKQAGEIDKRSGCLVIVAEPCTMRRMADENVQ